MWLKSRSDRFKSSNKSAIAERILPCLVFFSLSFLPPSRLQNWFVNSNLSFALDLVFATHWNSFVILKLEKSTREAPFSLEISIRKWLFIEHYTSWVVCSVQKARWRDCKSPRSSARPIEQTTCENINIVDALVL